MKKEKINILILVSMLIVLIAMTVLIYIEIDKNRNMTEQSAVQTAEVIEESPQNTPVATPIPAPTPTPFVVAQEIFIESIELNRTRFLTSTYNGNLIWLNEDRNIVMQDKDTNEQRVIKEIGEEKYYETGNNIFTVKNGDADKPIVYYTKLLDSRRVAPEYEEIYHEYFSNLPMSELYSTQSGRPLVDFIGVVIDCKDDKIIYLNENLEVYEFDMVTQKINKLYNDEDEYINAQYIINRNKDFYKYKKITYNYLIEYVSDEAVVTVQGYEIKDDYTISYDSNIYKYQMPYNGYVKRITATGTNVYICYTDTYNEPTYCRVYMLNVNTGELKEIANNTLELDAVYSADGNLFISYKLSNDEIKVLFYDYKADQFNVVFEGESKNESIDEYTHVIVTDMVYKNNKLLGYCTTEGGRSSLIFDVDVEE